MATKLPPVNATLVKVEGGGTSEDYDVEPGVDAIRWQGSASAHVLERVMVETGSGTVDQLTITQIVVPSYVEVTTGDELTWTRAGETTTRTARNIEDRSDFGFTRVYLEDS